MPELVAVTGIGVCTAFGAGVDAVRRGVFGGTAAFAPVTRFDAAPYRNRFAAVLPDDHAVWASGSPAQLDLLRACTTEALDGARTRAKGAPFLLGTLGDRSGVLDFWRAEEDHAGYDDARLGVSSPAALAAVAAQEFGFGSATAFSNACTASTTALAYGAQLIRSGDVDLVVCGGSYVVSEDIFAKFDAGGAFSGHGVVRPFCRQRDGMLHGDGAAVLVLESVPSARRRGAQTLALLRGWGLSADAHHPIQPDPAGHGMALAMRAAMRVAGCSPDDIGYVNAHGTGTPVNDKAETAALYDVFGARAGTVPVSSTKGATGHMLEATGAVEAVITVLALGDQRIPPTAGFLDPDPDCALDCVPNRGRAASPTYALSLNAAFGGANAALLFGTE
ncbi:beta-ketoacyl synthase [Actinoplanes sp. N902-109]|uniref:beta-ketoacyl-[acyl-carrier-protein] synthase family protein n=1 Tax=Actinoplanes sp. (strain N902-109) TaxID=649831 RepID=UPI00032944CF|nr:beta-ketoacyl-[acyl-carrier-protein] synthase family protein [Actinoplanes sp. N902-109]AGL16381.1 AsuC13 [Actinoplanes sp. N902-109]